MKEDEARRCFSQIPRECISVVKIIFNLTSKLRLSNAFEVLGEGSIDSIKFRQSELNLCDVEGKYNTPEVVFALRGIKINVTDTLGNKHNLPLFDNVRMRDDWIQVKLTKLFHVLSEFKEIIGD